MKKIENLSNERLMEETKRLVSKERELLTDILWHLREIESRKLYAEYGYPSLFEYAVQELKYSEGAAARRISAMRLLKELPEVEEALKAGTHTLSTISTLQTFFRQEDYSKEEKKELFQELSGKSQRETERVWY